MSVDIRVGDCLDVLRTLPIGSVQCCVTSPPYFGLRDYGVAGQLGLEPTPGEYVAKLVEVFAEVRRVLKADGTLWLNLGDSYTGSGKGGNPDAGKQATNIGPKQLIGIPWRVVLALQADGWTLRSDIIWHKPNPMPESVTDRPTKAHEYLFLLSKSPTYYYDASSIAEPCLKGDAGSEFHTGKTAEHQLGRASKNRTVRSGVDVRGGGQGSGSITYPLDKRNRRTVWTVPTHPFSEAHFATFPPTLIEPCILAGSKQGDTILDPFGGAGTTGLVADRLGRNALLIELNPEYAAMARRRITDDAPLFADGAA